MYASRGVRGLYCSIPHAKRACGNGEGIEMKVRHIVVCAGLAFGMVMVGSPAHAATTLVASDYPGVYGSASVTFKSGTRVEPIDNLYVKDRACDSSAVYVRFIVYAAGGTWRSQERRNTNGCNTEITWSGLYINDFNGINGIRLEACVDSLGSDECDTSAYLDNPYR